ncbi:MAG: cation:proton antiporter [Oscillospiraceae bacterium]|nr:cation:proton antiporter [Oscillospiraceae bacterium]
MEAYECFKDLAIIIISAKLLGLAAKKLRAPQVVGQIAAGLLIGPSVLGLVGQSDFIAVLAEIGVVLLMFSAGLETNLRELVKTGPVALSIACAGVFVPLVLGWALYGCFFGFAPVGSDEFFRGVFIGTIMTATSVSITVQTLRELGHLKGRVGTIIVSSAIIDDVIGIIVLTFVIGFRSADAKPLDVVIKTVLFIAFSFVIGFLIYLLFKFLDKRSFHHRRIPIFGLALCFVMAYCAERFFGIADITGAYVAGIILCNLRDAEYIAGKMDISSYMLFGPVFFASIGLKTNFDGFTLGLLWFSLAFVAVAMASKVIGCGLAAKAWRFNAKDSLKCGVGMMTRGEVALIVAQKGLAVGMVSPEYFTSVILLILCSSVASPIILKLLYKGEDKPDHVLTTGEMMDIDETDEVYAEY